MFIINFFLNTKYLLLNNNKVIAMLRVRKYRIYPTEEQRKAIMTTFGCARVVYNACLDAYNQHYTEWKKGGKLPDTFDNSLPKVSELKPEKPWLAEADSLALGQARLNFINALDAFYKSRSGERKGQKVGFPKYKKTWEMPICLHNGESG
jgi:putative transposase